MKERSGQSDGHVVTQKGQTAVGRQTQDAVFIFEILVLFTPLHLSITFRLKLYFKKCFLKYSALLRIKPTILRPFVGGLKRLGTTGLKCLTVDIVKPNQYVFLRVNLIMIHWLKVIFLCEHIT